MKTAGEEGISKNFVEKPKRGRPSAIPLEMEIAMRTGGVYEGNSRLGKVNRYYAMKAAGALVVDHPDGKKAGRAAYVWLVSEDDSRWKFTILAELGRMGDPETIRAMSARVCELKPKTADAVLMIRRTRLGRSAPASCIDLTVLLLRTIEKYVTGHQETTRLQMRGALLNCIEALEAKARQRAGDANLKRGNKRPVPVNSGEPGKPAKTRKASRKGEAVEQQAAAAQK